jgi:peroxiredoxin
MKKIMFLISLLLIVIGAVAQPKLKGDFTVNLDVSKVKSKPTLIYCWYNEIVKGVRQQKFDSVAVVDGHATFHGNINEPTEAFLSQVSLHTKVRQPKGNYFTFYLQPGNLEITSIDSLHNYTMKGGAFTKDYNAYEKLGDYASNASDIEVHIINKLDRKKDSVAYHEAFKRYATIINDWTGKTNKDYFIANAKITPVALIALRTNIGFIITNPEEADSLYNLLSPGFKVLPSGIQIKDQIEIAKCTNIGRMAMDFSQPDTAGKMISLSSFRGKYVLLDFWASWCGPCRAENPTVVADYNKYKGDKFTILSVSLDRESAKAAWLKAIHEDHLNQWTHVSDLKQFENEAAILYGVKAIPQNFLIDPSGKIIAKNLRGPALTEKLVELFVKM